MGIILPADGRGLLLPGGPQTFNPRYFVVPDGLVGYWGLDSDCLDFSAATAIDLAFSNNGTLNNLAASSYRDGQVAGALTFNGTSSQITFGSTPAILAPTTGVTVCAWYYMVGNGGGPVADTSIIDARRDSVGTNANGYVLQVQSAANSRKVRFFIYDTTFQGGGTSGISLNQWSHVCGTWDKASGNIFVYINASLKDTFTGHTTAIDYTSSTFRIGASGFNSTAREFANGYIDEARVYSRALSPSEILQVYYSGLQGRRDAGPWLPPDVELPAINTQAFVAAWAMGRNQINQGWAS